MNSNIEVAKKIAVKMLQYLSVVSITELDENDERRNDILIELNEWLVSENLFKKMEKEYKIYLKNPTEIKRINFSWLEERVAVYAWALGFDINVFDYRKQALLSEENCFIDFGFLSKDPVGVILNSAILRDRIEIGRGRGFYFRLYDLYSHNYGEVSKELLSRNENEKFTLSPEDRLSMINDMKIKDENDDMKSIAYERYKAFDWLLEVF